jgi:LPXTG-site transpeptidase (sortase) family protein
MWGVRRVLMVVLVAAAVLVGAPAGADPVAAPPAPPDPPARSAALGRLAVPAIGVDAGMFPVGVTRAGHLAIGRSVRDVYRWRAGVLPGQQGSAVLAGHTWSQGPGVFDDLGRLRPGNLVVVGRNRFEVTRVRRVTGMSRSAVAELFSDRGAPRLVLLTCGDRNDLTGVYRTRIIVNARLLPSH